MGNDAKIMSRRRTKAIGSLLLIASIIVLIGLFIGFARSATGIVAAFAVASVALAYGIWAATDQATQRRAWYEVSALRTLSGFQFERHVSEYYKRRGYHVRLTRGGGDQGIDVIAERQGRRIGVQCKQWIGTVGNDAVQQALAGKLFYNCTDAVVVCTSIFSKFARQLASKTDVELIDGNDYGLEIDKFKQHDKPRFSISLLPTGVPLYIELGLLAIATIIIVTHFSNPLSSQVNNS